MLQVNSHFFVEKVGYHASGGVIVTIKVNSKPDLYFRYDEQDEVIVVLTDTYNQHNQLVYQFVLRQVHPPQIHFNDNDSTQL